MTGVSCSNCGRPICPEDMTPMPVGIHCPICAGKMREGGSASAYRAREGVSRRASALPFAPMLKRASAVKVIIGINLLVLLGMYATGAPTSLRTLYRFGALPGAGGQWWRLITAMFVHVGFLHLLFNTWATILFGPALEERYGRLKFVALYLAAGVLGNAFSLTFTHAGIGAGASGGVFGILGAWLAFFIKHRDVPSLRGQVRSIAFLIGINLVFGVVVPGIDVFAHVGGLIAGFGIGAALEYSAKMSEAVRRASWVGAVVVAVSAAAVLAGPHLA